MGRRIEQKKVLVYRDFDGREPFSDWLYGLRDAKARQAVLRRVGRLESGLYGDCKFVGNGVMEMRIFLGSGYRVYFAEGAENIVVLLCGGDKSSQSRDIKIAQHYWRQCKANET